MTLLTVNVQKQLLRVYLAVSYGYPAIAIVAMLGTRNIGHRAGIQL